MTPCDSQQIDQRVEVPQPVLDGGRGQHQDVAEAASFQSVPEPLGDLRRLLHSVEVSKLVRFVEDQHLEAVLRNGVEIEPGRIVGRDDRAGFLRISLIEVLADGDLCRDVELGLVALPSIAGPATSEQTISTLVNRVRAMSSLRIRPALIVFPRPTSSARSVTGRRRQKVMRLVT